jgi:predicted dinucleotide-binding enzyme
MFIAGNDETAKTKAKVLLTEFGWKVDNLIDLGGITSARAMESYLVLWTTMLACLGVPMVSLKIIKPSA